MKHLLRAVLVASVSAPAAARPWWCRSRSNATLTTPAVAVLPNQRSPEDRQDRPCEAERATTAKAIAACVSLAEPLEALVTERGAAVVATAGGLAMSDYRAVFTLLDTPVVRRAWLTELQTGSRLGPN